ncbi:MAG: YbaB/EbfC family nucleoid-associated protein [Bacteroidetes bacterium]|nr:YbaB/EbfC family nucleoid-associated protein [Bacteroidota bacterium]
MFDKFKDMMGQLQLMQQKAEEVKAALDNLTVSESGAGGDIKITMTGNRRVVSLSIDPALQHGDKEELEEQLTVTLNRAIAKADALNESEMKKVAGGMMPGLF